jgi:predicted secreted protein
MKVIPIICLAALLLLSAGDVYAQNQSPQPEEPDAVIEATAGEYFTINLESNQVLGLKWRLAKPIDPDMVKLINVKFQRATARILAIPGEETWRFRAMKSGTTIIHLKYTSSSNRNAPPKQEKIFTINVKEPPKSK